MSSSRLGVQSASLPFDQRSGRGGESIYQQLRDLTLSREISRSPSKAPPVRSPSRSSRHSPTQQPSKSVADWLSGDGRSHRIEPSAGGDRRSRATERDRDSGRRRRRSVSSSTQSSLVSRSPSRSRSRGHHSRRRAHSPVSTDLGSQTSYSSSSHPKSHTSHRHHHKHRRDRSRSSSHSRSSSRERSKREKQKALKTGLLLLGSVAAATAAAQKLWSSDAARDERKKREADRRDNREADRRDNREADRRDNREADRRDNRSGHHQRRTSRERVRDPPNRERLGVKDGAGVKTTPALPAPASVAPRMHVEPPRSVYHPHYEETQYAAAPDDGEAIWMPEEESIGWNSRGEVVVETIERRVGPPSEAASKRKSHGGRRSGNDDRGDEDAYRGVERYKIMDEWDPRWKKY